MTGYIYLASPYTAYLPDGSFDNTTMEQRYRAVMEVTAHLAASGLTVYSPIAMSHAMDSYLGRLEPSFWYEFDRPMLLGADALFILELEGWKESKGINAEVALAKEHDILILNLRYTGLNLCLKTKP